MSLSLKIFVVYSLFVSLCSYFITSTVMEEIRPGVRQSTEETLVDTANLLAEFLQEPLQNGTLNNGEIANIFYHYGKRQLNAEIWGFKKNSVNHRIYVTNQKGIVLLDSHNIAVGQDYSRWNDVHLTLQGKYGARSTEELLGNDKSTVMYIGAPIKNGNDIIGVVSVAKPNRSVQPFIARTQQRLGKMAAAIIVLGLASGALFSWWLGRELKRLRQYALSVSAGERATLPTTNSLLRSNELHGLAKALESMRKQLDGKAYVEHYVQTFAHELKSPLAAIRAASELLQGPMSKDKKVHFLNNIDHESKRLEQLISHLLRLAALEQQQAPSQFQDIFILEQVNEIVGSFSALIERKQLNVVYDIEAGHKILGEVFLIHQALVNVLDNAIAYCPPEGTITIRSTIAVGTDAANNVSPNVPVIQTLQLTVHNTGPQIPDFALPRLTERFYSLPRPESGKKSTGLGLCFVSEVLALHKGTLKILNANSGVKVIMLLPQL